MEYRGCFIGIPLPQELYSEWNNLVIKLREVEPYFIHTRPELSHLTLVYLGKHNDQSLNQVMASTANMYHLLSGANLKVGGMGYFDNPDQLTMYLEVEDQQRQIYDFNSGMSKQLGELAPSTFDPYHPHLTLSAINDKFVRRRFPGLKDQFKERVDQVNWQFPVREVVLFAKDKQTPIQPHSRLATFQLAV